MQRNVTDDFNHDIHLPDSFYFDICVFQVGGFGLKTQQEEAELHECCDQSSLPNLQKLRRWLGGFRGSFAWDRQAVRILNSDLCLNVSTSSCNAPHR